MGFGNQALVRQTAKRYRLTHVEEKVCDYIAHKTFDEGTEDPRGHRTYWGGFKAIAKRLDLKDPEGRVAQDYVGRIMARLVRKGALEHLSTGHRGHAAVYRLAMTVGVDNVVPFPVDKPEIAHTESEIAHTPRMQIAHTPRMQMPIQNRGDSPYTLYGPRIKKNQEELRAKESTQLVPRITSDFESVDKPERDARDWDAIKEHARALGIDTDGIVARYASKGGRYRARA